MSFHDNYQSADKAIKQFCFSYKAEKGEEIDPDTNIKQTKNAKTGKQETRLILKVDDDIIASLLALITEDKKLFVNNKSLKFFTDKLKKGAEPEQPELTEDLLKDLLQDLKVDA